MATPLAFKERHNTNHDRFDDQDNELIDQDFQRLVDQLDAEGFTQYPSSNHDLNQQHPHSDEYFQPETIC